MIPVGSKLTFPGAEEGRDVPAMNAGAIGGATGATRVQRKPANVSDDDWGRVQGELGKMSSNSMTLDQLRNAGPNSLGNDPKMEMQWAEKAARHAEAYFAVLKLFGDKKKLKLTKVDDEIYADFRKTFPKLKVAAIDEATLKSEQSKAKWRPFCMRYKNRAEVTDYNFGSLLRLNASIGYEDANTTIVPRVQFLAIEIARNRETYNDGINKATVCPLAEATKAHSAAAAAVLQPADVLAADQKAAAAASSAATATGTAAASNTAAAAAAPTATAAAPAATTAAAAPTNSAPAAAAKK